MSILLGLLIAVHACWSVLGKQLRKLRPTSHDCLLALCACCLEIGLLGALIGNRAGIATWLFAALPSAVYLAAVSIDVLNAEHG